MPLLDIRTILVLTALSSLINAAVMIFIYRIAPRYPGLNRWALGNTAFAIGCVLVLARGQIPNLVSILRPRRWGSRAYLDCSAMS